VDKVGSASSKPNIIVTSSASTILSSNDQSGARRRAGRDRPSGTFGSTRTPSSLQKSNRDASALLELKRTKFVVAATKMVSYICLLSTACWALHGETDWLFDPFKQHISFWPHVPMGIKVVYLAESGYYVYTLFSMFWEPRMKDRNQMVAHHVFTLFLLLSSYYWNALKYGVSIALLHDLSDPLMEAAKLFNYAGIEIGSHIFFSIFAISFFYLRVWIFPSRIILATLYVYQYLPSSICSI
jgi:hypothetical protein